MLPMKIFYTCAAALLLGLLSGPALLDAQERQAPQQQKKASAAAPAAVKDTKSLEEERLAILRADIQRELEAYKKLKKEVEGSQKASADKAAERLLRVAKMYESMPAEEAAGTLAKLEEGLAVTILAALKPKSAGKILAQMEDDKAAALSKRLLKSSREKGSP